MHAVDVQREVLAILDEVLNLGGRSAGFGPTTPLLGSVPELDSMAVVALITAIEERLGIVFEDEDIDATTFASVGNLLTYVNKRLAA